MEDTQDRIITALAREEARAESLANRIRLILFAIFTVIAIANVWTVEVTTTLINVGALLVGYLYGGTIYFAVKRAGYRPAMKYVTTFLDIFLVYCVLFVYTRLDIPSVGLKNYVFMVIFPIIALTLFRYDPKFTRWTGAFAVILYLLLFVFLYISGSLSFDTGYSSELFSAKITLTGQLTKVLILCAYVVIVSYLAHYTRRLFIKLVATEVRARVENDDMVRELEVASQVQTRLLPETYPQVRGLEMSGTVLAGKFVGGDYFDFLRLSPTRLAVIVADVSGHGVPAALIMAEVRASVHLLAEAKTSLADLAKQLNTLLHRSTTSKDYVTFFVGEIDTAKDVVRYINAGHPPPILCSRGKVQTLPGRTLGLGIVSRLPKLAIRRATFGAGSTLLCYTDGVTERTNAAEGEYGERRLREFLLGHLNIGAGELTQRLLDEVKEFGGGKELDDDLTVAVVRRM